MFFLASAAHPLHSWEDPVVYFLCYFLAFPAVAVVVLTIEGIRLGTAKSWEFIRKRIVRS